MANQNDSFIDEVTEDLRRDRLFLFLRRYGWIAILAIVALVGAAAWREWSAVRADRDARAFGDAILAAEATKGDGAARAAALSAVATTRPGQTALREVLAANAPKVASYRSGKTQLFGFFVGQVMKATKGSASPKAVNDVLTRLLAGDATTGGDA